MKHHQPRNHPSQAEQQAPCCWRPSRSRLTQKQRTELQTTPKYTQQQNGKGHGKRQTQGHVRTIDDANLVSNIRRHVVLQPRSQDLVHFLCLAWCGHLARANRPNRLVCNNNLVPVRDVVSVRLCNTSHTTNTAKFMAGFGQKRHPARSPQRNVTKRMAVVRKPTKSLYKAKRHNQTATAGTEQENDSIP